MDNECYYHRVLYFIKYTDTFADRSFKVRAGREVTILYDGTDKNDIKRSPGKEHTSCFQSCHW